MDFDVGVQDMCMMQATPTLFKILTNFILNVFKELASFMVFTITSNTRFTNEVHILARCLSKCNVKKHLLGFILYMKHDKTMMFDSFMWNWVKFNVCDDAIFFASCINPTLANEIH
jgi:hypothetical protein